MLNIILVLARDDAEAEDGGGGGWRGVTEENTHGGGGGAGWRGVTEESADAGGGGRHWHRNLSPWHGSSRPTFKGGTAQICLSHPTFWQQIIIFCREMR